MGCMSSTGEEELEEKTIKDREFHAQKIYSGDDDGNELNRSWELLSKRNMTIVFNDTVIKTHTLNNTLSSEITCEGRKTILTFAPLEQVVKYKIGEELMCMSWNLSHYSGGTPFDYYCDFRNFSMNERDVISVEIIWDVARVFLSKETPTELSKTTKLKTVVPSYLLLQETLKNFSNAVHISGKERDLVMKFPELSLYDFLLALSYDEEINQVLRNESSFMKTHSKFSNRASSPLQLNYKPSAFKALLKKDPAILPVLILDSLHTLAIRFAAYLLYNDLVKAFSDYESSEQIKKLEAYCAKTTTDDLALPNHFLQTRRALYEKWNSVFQEENVLKQIEKKLKISHSDIVLLQEVTKVLFNKLKGQLSKSYAVFPKKFPSKMTHTTVVCLNNTTVKVDKEKIRHMNELNFAVPCHSSDIKFHVGIVSLSPGRSCGELRKKEVSRFKRILGNDPAIVGGNFNEDLTAFDNPVSRIMLKRFNGIDHTQAMPLACTTNPTRTNLQFNVAQSDRRKNGVENGIYSSFPLAGDASTDFLYPGMNNPSDRGPVFQRIRLALI